MNWDKVMINRLKLVGALLVLAVGAMVLLQALTRSLMVADPLLSLETLTPSESQIPLARSNPIKLSIPAIRTTASFVELGLQGDGEIEVPKTYESVGWYTYGPTPGEIGPAVILGHVDSYLGPAVFFSLGQLNPGDTIEIDREDGTKAMFRVDKLERYPQESFPTSLVYGDLDYAGLRLITCSGSYNRESQRYDYNLIVYASLIETITN